MLRLTQLIFRHLPLFARVPIALKWIWPIMKVIKQLTVSIDLIAMRHCND